MKRDTQPSLQQLWKLKRENTPAASSESAELPPALATRIAARWAVGGGSHNPFILWERLMTGGLAVALIVCATAAWLRPALPPSGSQDLMLSLFTARPAPGDDFPF